MSGHGWVTPSPNGIRARCGGPAICRECALEKVRADLAAAGRPDDRAVSGYFPAGCGATLFRAADGRVSCSGPDCPRPAAVADLLADQETEHIVVFGETEFTVRHPLRERLDDALMDCDLHKDIAAMDGPPVEPGTYRARWADYDAATPGYGRWTWEPVP